MPLLMRSEAASTLARNQRPVLRCFISAFSPLGADIEAMRASKDVLRFFPPAYGRSVLSLVRTLMPTGEVRKNLT